MKFLTGFKQLLGETPAWIKGIVTPIQDVVNLLLWPIITIIATVGVIYAIVLGVNYAKAESSDAKEEAKKRIINVVVGAVLGIVLMIVLYLLVTYAEDIVTWIQEIGTTKTP